MANAMPRIYQGRLGASATKRASAINIPTGHVDAQSSSMAAKTYYADRALLMRPEYAGTLAASRALAHRGVSVCVAAPQMLAPALWSRSVVRRLRCPNFRQGPSRILEWLLQQGVNAPGAVLYPTCDEMAWLVSRHQDQLSAHYRLYSPPHQTIRVILDKRELYATCNALGIEVPRTWYPINEAELDQVAANGTQFLIKPRTQTFVHAPSKGGLARTTSELKQTWFMFRTASRFAPEILAEMGDIEIPIVQEYISDAERGVYSISGFIDRQGNVLATRGSRKLLQLPPNAGIGVCFDSVEPPLEALNAITLLCRQLGYFGVFEVEFLQTRGRQLLIDFNPRYFGQMGFDIARGLDLPWLAHLCASGFELEAAEEALAMCSTASSPTYYWDQLAIEWRMATGRVGGAISESMRDDWRDWIKTRAAAAADALVDGSDPGPTIAAAASMVWNALRHPRGFWRYTRIASREAPPHEGAAHASPPSTTGAEQHNHVNHHSPVGAVASGSQRITLT